MSIVLYLKYQMMPIVMIRSCSYFDMPHGFSSVRFLRMLRAFSTCRDPTYGKERMTEHIVSFHGDQHLVIDLCTPYSVPRISRLDKSVHTEAVLDGRHCC